MRIDTRLRTVAFLLVIAVCTQQSWPVGATEPRARTNAERFREAVGVWERGNIADMDKFITADYRGHTSSGDRDRTGLQKRIETFAAKYSEVRFQIMDQVASGDRVASRLEATATENATGQSIRMIGMNVSRFRDGKIGMGGMGDCPSHGSSVELAA